MHRSIPMALGAGLLVAGMASRKGGHRHGRGRACHEGRGTAGHGRHARHRGGGHRRGPWGDPERFREQVEARLTDWHERQHAAGGEPGTLEA